MLWSLYAVLFGGTNVAWPLLTLIHRQFVAAHTDERKPKDCMMTEIASTHFCITYRPPDTMQRLEVARIPFDPPLAGYEEVRPRLVAMKADAEEKVGMVCLNHFMQDD